MGKTRSNIWDSALRSLSSKLPKPVCSLSDFDDTKFVLLTHVISSYAAGLPAALLLAIVARPGAQSVFAARALEEVLKMFILLLRYRTPSWYRKSMNRTAVASSKP